MCDTAIVNLSRDSRLIALAGEYVGSAAMPFRATLFDKSPQSNWLIPWHQDTALPLTHRFEAAGWGPWSQKGGLHYAHAPAWALEQIVALRIHLDPSEKDNGPLRIVPGSHRRGVLTDEQVGAAVQSNGFEECLVSCGGVIAMRPLAVHSSSKAAGARPRRVLHIEYAASLDLAEGIRLAIA